MPQKYPHLTNSATQKFEATGIGDAASVDQYWRHCTNQRDGSFGLQNRIWGGLQKKDMGVVHFSLGAHPQTKRTVPLVCAPLYKIKPLWDGRQKKEMGAAHFSLGAHPFPRHITCLNSLGAYSSSVWNTGISRIKLSSSEISVSVAVTPEMCWILSLSSSIKCWLSRA